MEWYTFPHIRLRFHIFAEHSWLRQSRGDDPACHSYHLRHPLRHHRGERPALRHLGHTLHTRRHALRHHRQRGRVRQHRHHDTARMAQRPKCCAEHPLRTRIALVLERGHLPQGQHGTGHAHRPHRCRQRADHARTRHPHHPQQHLRHDCGKQPAVRHLRVPLHGGMHAVRHTACRNGLRQYCHHDAVCLAQRYRHS